MDFRGKDDSTSKSSSSIILEEDMLDIKKEEVEITPYSIEYEEGDFDFPGCEDFDSEYNLAVVQSIKSNHNGSFVDIARPLQDESIKEASLCEDPLKNTDSIKNTLSKSAPPNIWTPVLNCERKCHLRIKEKDQKEIFVCYWQNSTVKSRFDFLYNNSELVQRPESENVYYDTKFYLNTKEGHQEMCRTCFRRILGERNDSLKVVLNDKLLEMKRVRKKTEGIESKNRKDERIWPPPYYCNQKCYLKITKDEQKLIFNSYRKGSSFHSRLSFLNETIKLVPKYNRISSDHTEEEYAPRFYFKTTGSFQRVCEACFRHILGEEMSFIMAVIRDKILKIIESKEEKLRNEKPQGTSKSQSIPETKANKDFKVKAKKCWTRISHCSSKCYLKVTDKDQECIFVSYWDDSTFKSRYRFLNDMIHITPVEDHSENPHSDKMKKLGLDYFLDTVAGRVSVCKLCFLTALGEQEKMLKMVIDDKILKIYNSVEVEQNLQTGKNNEISKESIKNDRPLSVDEKTKEVEAHIMKFPLSGKNHNITDDDSVKYLPFGLTIKVMYSLYRNEVSNPVGIDAYQEVLTKMNLKFHTCLVKCEKCATVKERIKLSTPIVQNKIMYLQEVHLREAAESYKCYLHDIRAARAINSLFVFSFSLHQSLPTPLLNEPTSYYTQPLWTYGLTIQAQSERVKSELKTYMWYENQGKKTVNEIASCLYQYLQNLPSSVESVIIYSTSCNGESRRKNLSMMFLHLLANHKTLKTVNHKFLVDKHSPLEDELSNDWLDLMKNHLGEIQQPKDWFDAFSNAPGKQCNAREVVVMDANNFYDFEALLKKTLRKSETFMFENVVWLRYTKEGIFCKYSWSKTDPFHIMNLEGQFTFNDLKNRKLKKLEVVPMTEEKRKNVLNFLPFINPNVESFYVSLLGLKNKDINSTCSLNLRNSSFQKVKSPSWKRKLDEVDKQENSDPPEEITIIKEKLDFRDYRCREISQKSFKKMANEADIRVIVINGKTEESQEKVNSKFSGLRVYQKSKNI